MYQLAVSLPYLVSKLDINLGRRIHFRINFMWIEGCHRDLIACAALVFKNRLLGLANFLGGKMDPFSQIQMFSSPPSRLFV